MATDVAKIAVEALVREIESLRDAVRKLAEPLTEKQFWTKPIDPGNSVGHLVLHLTGNVTQRLGAQIAGNGFIRDREREFTETNVPSKTDALAKLDEAVALYRRVAEGLSADRLAEPFPEGLYPNVLNGLLFVVIHFALHRGQMSYIVRLLPP